jgi:hypothetical protein
MKRLVIVIILLAAIAFGVYKLAFSVEKKATIAAEKDQPLAISKNSIAFNESFAKVLNDYFSLKSALTDYDTVKANAAAGVLAVDADSLKINEIKGDTTGAIKATAGNAAGTISGSAKGLIGETDLVKKKREFQMISDAIYDLARTVQYDRMKLFHQHCPMAFNESEDGTWLSNSDSIVNPYLGSKHPKFKDKMLHCGDITDSLGFTK